MKLEEAAQVLGIEIELGEPTLAQVNQAWRDARSRLHPDREGGDADKFDRARKAYDLLHRHVTRPRVCPDCLGEGKTSHARGFTVLKLPCSRCRGTGEIRYQVNGEHR